MAPVDRQSTVAESRLEAVALLLWPALGAAAEYDDAAAEVGAGAYHEVAMTTHCVRVRVRRRVARVRVMLRLLYGSPHALMQGVALARERHLSRLA